MTLGRYTVHDIPWDFYVYSFRVKRKFFETTDVRRFSTLLPSLRLEIEMEVPPDASKLTPLVNSAQKFLLSEPRAPCPPRKTLFPSRIWLHTSVRGRSTTPPPVRPIVHKVLSSIPPSTLPFSGMTSSGRLDTTSQGCQTG